MLGGVNIKKGMVVVVVVPESKEFFHMKKVSLFLLFLVMSDCFASMYVYDQSGCARPPQLCFPKGIKRLENKRPYAVELFELKRDQAFDIPSKRRFFYVALPTEERKYLLFEFDRRVSGEYDERYYLKGARPFYFTV